MEGRKIIATAILSVLSIPVVIAISLFIVKPVIAQTAATTTESTASPESANTPASAASAQTTASSQKYTLAHLIGTKYIDYFTDGRTTVSFPGDPAIDGNFNKPNAPIPTHDNLKWVSTSGFPLYDTPSGDLDVNYYVQKDDGSYDVHVGPSTYTDATSTVALPDRVIGTQSDPAVTAPIL